MPSTTRLTAKSDSASAEDDVVFACLALKASRLYVSLDTTSDVRLVKDYIHGPVPVGPSAQRFLGDRLFRQLCAHFVPHINVQERAYHPVRIQKRAGTARLRGITTHR